MIKIAIFVFISILLSIFMFKYAGIILLVTIVVSIIAVILGALGWKIPGISG